MQAVQMKLKVICQILIDFDRLFLIVAQYLLIDLVLFFHYTIAPA